MYRPNKMTGRIGELTSTEKAALFDHIATGDVEMNGGFYWAEKPAEETLLGLLKKKKATIERKFPLRFAETEDLKAEGTLSVDGKKKLILVTQENIGDVKEMHKEIPEDFVLTVKYLESLSYIDLRAFVKARPELDKEIHLSKKKDFILSEVIRLSGLEHSESEVKL